MTRKTVSLLLALCMALVCLAGCAEEAGLSTWNDMLYSQDTELGEGAKTVQVAVYSSGDHHITFTIHTDAKTLGEALVAHKLVEGEQGDYGLYVKKVNGLLADADVDGYYWGLYKNGEMMMTGVDGVVIADGEHYELKREK